jgi:uncharacterized protein YegJ (DUF2314 family)
MILRWTTLLLGLLLTLGCGGPAEANQEEPIYQVPAEDKEMNAAKAKAVATLPEFYARLARPGDATEFMIKFDILPGEDAEFVWADALDRTGSPMTGVLVNKPEATDHRIGQRVPIPEADIIDWMYRKGGKMQGGFTNRVLLERMPAEDAASFREYLGW